VDKSRYASSLHNANATVVGSLNVHLQINLHKYKHTHVAGFDSNEENLRFNLDSYMLHRNAEYLSIISCHPFIKHGIKTRPDRSGRENPT
jgi:hypothetical protein